MKKPFYIAVEGIDGAGKTTQSNQLVRYLRRRGYSAVLVHEPSGMETGRLIRKALANRVEISEYGLALLFAADRLAIREKVIEPSLRKGYIVVSDRTVVSSLAYQSAATGQRRWVEEVNRFAAKPDIVVFIDIPPAKALRRLGKSSQRYERAFFLSKVRKEYLRVLKNFDRVVIVDGDKPLPEVTRGIVKGLSKFIPGLLK